MSMPNKRARFTGGLARWVENRSMNTKIISIITVLGVTAIFVGVMSLTRMSELNDQAQWLYKMSVIPVSHAEELSITMRQTRGDMLNDALSTTDATMTKYEQALRVDDTNFARQAQQYKNESIKPELVDQLVANWRDYQTSRQQIVDARRGNDSEAIERLRDNVTS